MCWEVSRYFRYDWIERYWMEPDFFFTYDGFHWLSPWSGDGMYFHFVALGILAFCIAIGLLYRLSTVLFFLGFTYIFLLDKTNYLNHFYLISLVSFLLIFIDAHRRWSVDAWLWPEWASARAPRWMVTLLQFQIGVAYFFGGVAKINHDWLRGEPMRSWLAQSTDFPLVGSLFTHSWAPYFFSYSGLLLDLLIVPLLLWRRTRLLAYGFIVLFHLTNARLFSIGIFPWMMIFVTTIYFDPDWFEKLLARMGIKGAVQKVQAETYSYFLKNRNAIVYSLLLFASVQFLLPFRHLLYPSNVHWTEEGHRFAWHMKLRNKDAIAQFKVINQETQKEKEIELHKVLSQRQQRKMSTRPDMILQFAHYIGQQFQQNGFEDVAVYARVKASLNGRRPQEMIRSDVDLMQIDKRHDIYDWVLPLTEPLHAEE